MVRLPPNPLTVSSSFVRCGLLPAIKWGQLRYGFAGVEGLWPVHWTPPSCGRGPEAHRGHVQAPGWQAARGSSACGAARPRLCPRAGLPPRRSHCLSGDAEPDNERAERPGRRRGHLPPRHRLPHRPRLPVRLRWGS